MSVGFSRRRRAATRRVSTWASTSSSAASRAGSSPSSSVSGPSSTSAPEAISSTRSSVLDSSSKPTTSSSSSSKRWATLASINRTMSRPGSRHSSPAAGNRPPRPRCRRAARGAVTTTAGPCRRGSDRGSSPRSRNCDRTKSCSRPCPSGAPPSRRKPHERHLGRNSLDGVVTLAHTAAVIVRRQEGESHAYLHRYRHVCSERPDGGLRPQARTLTVPHP